MITVNGDRHPWHAGMTVRDLLAEKGFTFPLLITRIDGRLVPRDRYDDTPIPDGATVDVIHLMSGG
jgi:thiamine biosynthesis protein ThiS